MKSLEKFKNLGQILSKAQQKKILGGYGGGCSCQECNCCNAAICYLQGGGEQDVCVGTCGGSLDSACPPGTESATWGISQYCCGAGYCGY